MKIFLNKNQLIIEFCCFWGFFFLNKDLFPLIFFIQIMTFIHRKQFSH